MSRKCIRGEVKGRRRAGGGRRPGGGGGSQGEGEEFRGEERRPGGGSGRYNHGYESSHLQIIIYTRPYPYQTSVNIGSDILDY